MKSLMKNLNFYKIKKFNYVYTTPSTKLADLNYKEEIFEFFAYNSEKLNENEINEIFQKLFKFKILKNEIIDYKNFLRHFLTLDKDWINEDTVKNSLLLFLDKLGDINEYLNERVNHPESQIDANFYPVYLSFYYYMSKNYNKLKNENIILLFNYLSLFGNEDRIMLKNALLMYKYVDFINPFKPEHSAEIILNIIKMLRNKNAELDDEIKDVINKYALDIELKTLKNNKNHRELYFNLVKYILDIKEVEKPIELINLSRRLEKFFFVNKINKKDVLNEFETESEANKLL
jgi:hypothetical protein